MWGWDVESRKAESIDVANASVAVVEVGLLVGQGMLVVEDGCVRDRDVESGLESAEPGPEISEGGRGEGPD